MTAQAFILILMGLLIVAIDPRWAFLVSCVILTILFLSLRGLNE